MPVTNLLALCAEAMLYFGVLALVFRLRRQLGMGVFLTALTTLHFLETYLATYLYVAVPGGFVVTPGSSVLFSGKLMLLLLVYVKEDATAVRQPIYGLLIGNLLTVGLALLLRLHETVPLGGREPDLALVREMGWLMVWGSLLLYLDSLAIVLVYEWLGPRLGARRAVRMLLSAALVLSFDQVAFYAALRLLVDAPPDVLIGGWIAKMAAALGYAVLAGLYLRFVEPGRRAGPIRPRLRELLGTLTYRARYRSLLDEAGRDPLTGALTRGRLEAQGRPAMDLALASGQEVSLVLIDLDRFRAVDARHGRASADEALRRVAAALQDGIGPGDHLFRHGGDQFVVCATGLTPERGVVLAERLRASVATVTPAGALAPLSASVTVATGPAEGVDFDALFAVAGERLVELKRMGRSRASSLDQMLSAAAVVPPQRRLSLLEA